MASTLLLHTTLPFLSDKTSSEHVAEETHLSSTPFSSPRKINRLQGEATFQESVLDPETLACAWTMLKNDVTTTSNDQPHGFFGDHAH